MNDDHQTRCLATLLRIQQDFKEAGTYDEELDKLLIDVTEASEQVIFDAVWEKALKDTVSSGWGIVERRIDPAQLRLPERLRKLATGRVEWRVQNPETKAYCMSFDYGDSINPKAAAQCWLAEFAAKFPDHRHAKYEIAEVRVFTYLEQAALQAADALAASTVAPQVDAPKPLPPHKGFIDRSRHDQHIERTGFAMGQPNADAQIIALWTGRTPTAVAVILRDGNNWSQLIRWAAAPAASPMVDELATLIRMLVHAHRKAAPGNALAERAMDYLKRHDLTGNILRDSPAVEGAWQKFCEEVGAPAAPASPLTKDALVDLIRDNMHAVYHCTRVWNAWNVGTMSQDDFTEYNESDSPEELADAILVAMAASKEPQA